MHQRRQQNMAFESLCKHMHQKKLQSENEIHPHSFCGKTKLQRPCAKVSLHAGFILVENIDYDGLYYVQVKIPYHFTVIWSCKDCMASQAIVKKGPSILSLEHLFHRLWHAFDERCENFNINLLKTSAAEFQHFKDTQATTIYHIKNHCVLVQNVSKSYVQHVVDEMNLCISSFIYEDKNRPDIVHILHRVKPTCIKYYVTDVDMLLCEKVDMCKCLFKLHTELDSVPVHVLLYESEIF